MQYFSQMSPYILLRRFAPDTGINETQQQQNEM